MGRVYLACDLALDRPVALKVLARAIAERPDLRERFYREARAQARIQHPNVGHIYYIGEQDGELFFAMEYIEGESVAALLEREGALSPERALEICRQAALGLGEGQQRGFIHRDVKPSNLMVDRFGQVKVLDFGLVKEQGPGAVNLSVTGTEDHAACLVGTPLYMSPEQARGEAVDLRSDIYSLGATLHQLIAGTPPFEGPTPIAVISRHATDPRPRLRPDGKRRRFDAGLDPLLDRMMAKAPDRRFDSYPALVAALEGLQAARTRPAGFWVRLFAELFDFLTLSILSIPLQYLTPLDGNVLLPLLALPYIILLTARWGRTLGKRALQIEVTPIDRPGRVGLRTAVIRFLAQFGPSYLLLGGASIITQVADKTFFTTAAVIALIALGLAAPPLFGIASALAPGKRAFWDRIANTQVRYRLPS